MESDLAQLCEREREGEGLDSPRVFWVLTLPVFFGFWFVFFLFDFCLTLERIAKEKYFLWILLVFDVWDFRLSVWGLGSGPVGSVALSPVFLWVGWVVLLAESDGKGREGEFCPFYTDLSLHSYNFLFGGFGFNFLFACISNLAFVYFYPAYVFFSL